MQKIWLYSFLLSMSVLLHQSFAYNSPFHPQTGPIPNQDFTLHQAVTKNPMSRQQSTQKQPIMYMGRVPFSTPQVQITKICGQICQYPKFKFSGQTRVVNAMNNQQNIQNAPYRQCGCVVLPPKQPAIAIKPGFRGHGNPERYCPVTCATGQRMWNGALGTKQPFAKAPPCMCVRVDNNIYLSPNEIVRVRSMSARSDQSQKDDIAIRLGRTDRSVLGKILYRQLNNLALSPDEQLLLKSLEAVGMIGSMHNPGGRGATPIRDSGHPYGGRPPIPGTPPTVAPNSTQPGEFPPQSGNVNNPMIPR